MALNLIDYRQPVQHAFHPWHMPAHLFCLCDDVVRSQALVQAAVENKLEIAKDVSAMANANGGHVVYGMTEKDHLPTGLDAGIPPKPFDGLWFEQVIQQNTRPAIEGLRIIPISAENGNNYFVLEVPASNTVHQAKDGRYYRRRNFRNDIMEDYEVREAMNRSKTPEPFLDISLPEQRTPIRWLSDDSHSVPIAFSLTVGNRSITPSLYTHVIISVDAELVLTKSGGDEVLSTTHTDGQPMNAIIFKLFVPHHFPLFRERSFRLGSGTSIAIQRKFYTGDSMYRIKYDISTAGYSASRTGEFIKRGQELSLYWLKPSV